MDEMNHCEPVVFFVHLCGIKVLSYSMSQNVLLTRCLTTVIWLTGEKDGSERFVSCSEDVLKATFVILLP